MLGVVALPAFAYLLASLLIPESPRWLAARGRREEALQVLSAIDPASAQATLSQIETEAAEEARTINWRTFFDGHLRRPIALAFVIAMFNQLSGINAIIYFAPRIFELSGAGESTALLATVGIGAINMIFTFVGVMLIDRAGRKALMYVGSGGYLVSLGMTAWGFASGQFALVLPFILAFIAAHAIGQGAVIWVYISEIFPSNARAKGQSLGAGTHWVFAAALTLVMPAILATVAPAAIFAVFAGLMLLQLLWVRTAMIETRGRTLEDVAFQLSARS